MARVIATTAGTAGLAGLLLLGATGHLPLQALQALAGKTQTYAGNDGGWTPPSSPTSLSDQGGGTLDGDGMSKDEMEGDDVSTALATYGIDRDGNLFEVHSPQTEVPRLSGPTL